MKPYINKNYIMLFTFIISVLIITIGMNNNKKINKIEFDLPNVKLETANYIIIVGDSRMERIENNRKKLNIPKNIVIDAKSGAKINWLISELPNIYDMLNNKDEKGHYHVIFNFGVNDVDDNINIEKRAIHYFQLYEKLAAENKDVDFYLLSVNPVDEKRIYNYFLNNARTNERIEKFNYYTIEKINNSELDNIKYCDSYNSIKFNLPDGLHYDNNTDQKIIDYIINNCVEYK